MHEKSQKLLNQGVADELAAVHQYMYFHFQCDDQGYDLLAGMFRKIAIDEMMHIEHLAERILFLGGEVELKAAEEVAKIHDVKKMLEKAKAMEEGAVKVYNQFAIECTQNADAATKKIFEDLVADEEGHYDQFDNEIEAMEKFGDNYLALQSMERAKNRAAGKPAD